MMRCLVACLLMVAAVQAVDWTRVHAVSKKTVALKNAVSGRIIGGGQATPGQFPYMAGMILDETAFCGGSLISDHVVLTAANCIEGTSKYEVRLGAQNIRDDGEPTLQIVRTTDAIKHESYNPRKLDFDIGVVRLPKAVSGDGISILRLPRRSQASETFAGLVGRVSGWGKVSDGSSLINDELKYVDVTVITNEECTAAFEADISADKLCVDTDGGSASTCSGDAGGPLVITEDDGLPTEIGIDSFGSTRGCESGYPAGFTRITSYLDWIEVNGGVAIRP